MKIARKIFIVIYVASIFCYNCNGSSSSNHSLNKLIPVSTENCTVMIPFPNSEFLELLQTSYKYSNGLRINWHIQWISPEGKIQNRQLEFINGNQSTIIEFAKNRPSPVLAFLVINESEKILPAGAIYPINKSENILEASWINGVSAQVLMDILTKTEQSIEEAQHFCNYFNWQKLQEEIAKRTNAPWLLDRQKIVDKICTGSFSVSVIKEEKTYEDILPQNTVDWICVPYGNAKPIFAGEKSFFTLSKMVYLSSNGFVFIEKKSSSKNTLVITELAK